MITHYQRLGLDPTATDDEIRAAWRQTAFTTHPDQGGSLDEFLAARTAFEVLTDPVTRSSYDQELLATGAWLPPDVQPAAEPEGPTVPLRRLRVSAASLGSLGVLLTEIGRLETTRRHHLSHENLERLAIVEDRLSEAYRRVTPLAYAMGLQPATLLDDPELAETLAARPPRPAVRPEPAGEDDLEGAEAEEDEEVVPVHPVVLAPDGTELVYSERSIHGVAIPTAADARRYHLGRPSTLARLQPGDPLYRIPAPSTRRWPLRFLAALARGPRARQPGWVSDTANVAQAAFLAVALLVARTALPERKSVALALFAVSALWAISWPVRLSVRGLYRRRVALGWVAAVLLPPLVLVAGTVALYALGY